ERSGILTTSIGLLFHAGADGKVRAYDADTGKVLWTGTLPGASRGVPAMYEVNGRQYLVINATQGAVGTPANPSGPDRAYVAFALKKNERGSSEEPARLPTDERAGPVCAEALGSADIPHPRSGGAGSSAALHPLDQHRDHVPADDAARRARES